MPTATAFHHAGFHIVTPGKRRQPARIDEVGELGKRSRHEKQALLPIPAQERARREAAEEAMLHDEPILFWSRQIQKELA